MNNAAITHPIPPVYNSESKILILGSFPSPASRDAGFYYGNKRNRFWKLLANLIDKKKPQTRADKIKFLHAYHIALFDVIQSCRISGAADASIKDAKPNDISSIISHTKIQAIFLNGKTASKLFHHFFNSMIFHNIEEIEPNVFTLPSTSPANASYNFEKLISAWTVIKDFL
ncbi:DNA-deoxyinosine glycosylase [Treponema phagedenis]|uniref:DNA-deoxyinosine glycosylase n=1 Tax=Treponema phagedenis TaxID=162 RepID=UPI0001F63DFD|nr:DNA-deoxyinosine glycosylase [Treponema phagedenis]EFW38207.1 hypothetical protein HMPREF9554_01291 [Treponema phagedenis F0421]TYT77848.1 DNA-deoxyinosine glycosylase [Treponema phagedenis]